MGKSAGSGVRIDDVARLAGVSMKTVSRVFNHEPNVRPETRAKVEVAAKTLNFRPNPSARSLAGNRSYLVSLVYDNPSSSYVMQVVSGVLDACEAAHYSMMMRPVDYGSQDHVDIIVQSVAQYAPDGLVLDTPDRSALRAMQTPQAFRVELIRKAHDIARRDGFLGTDDAALLEHAGMPVYLCEGSRENLKLTTPTDLMLAGLILAARAEKELIG